MPNNKPTGWVGWVYFATAVLLIVGGLGIVAGLTAFLVPIFMWLPKRVGS